MKKTQNPVLNHALTNRSLDLILVGGGLANCIIAYGLKKFRPEVNFLILESKSKLAGNHTWSFHTHDLSKKQFEWIEPLIFKTWPFKTVYFPNYCRKINSEYHVINSEKINTALMEMLSPEELILNCNVSQISFNSVELESGESIHAKSILDGRGWKYEQSVQYGLHKFVGMDVTLTEPHHLNEAILMDTNCEQRNGFRYFYVLPWDEKTLFIKDTQYNRNDPRIREEEYLQDIYHYAQTKNWHIDSVQRVESGILHVPLTLPPYSTHAVGALGGFFHFTTGHSFHEAVKVAEAIIQVKSFSVFNIQEILTQLREKNIWNSQFLIFLNRLLFLDHKGEESRKVFEHFYKLSDSLVHRFFSNQLRLTDALKIISGKSSFFIFKALKGLPPFTKEKKDLLKILKL